MKSVAIHEAITRFARGLIRDLIPRHDRNPFD